MTSLHGDCVMVTRLFWKHGHCVTQAQTSDNTCLSYSYYDSKAYSSTFCMYEACSHVPSMHCVRARETHWTGQQLYANIPTDTVTLTFPPKGISASGQPTGREKPRNSCRRRDYQWKPVSHTAALTVNHSESKATINCLHLARHNLDLLSRLGSKVNKNRKKK